MMELIPCASWATVCQVESELEDELRQEGKRLLRLKQVFATNRADFHEALSAILGIAVAIYNSGQLRVMMQYDLGVAFIFQPAQGTPAVVVVMRERADVARCAGRGVPQELPKLTRERVEVEQSIRASWRTSFLNAKKWVGGPGW
jgi:hypothetical protein